MKKILGNIILLIHFLILPVSLIILIFIKNFYLNFILLAYNTFVIVDWLCLGNCLITPLENYLLGKKQKYDNGSERSEITVYLEKYTNLTKNNIYFIFAILPLIIIFILLIKIDYLYKCEDDN
jgi:hypothetical protein